MAWHDGASSRRCLLALRSPCTCYSFSEQVERGRETSRWRGVVSLMLCQWGSGWRMADASACVPSSHLFGRYYRILYLFISLRSAYGIAWMPQGRGRSVQPMSIAMHPHVFNVRCLTSPLYLKPRTILRARFTIQCMLSGGDITYTHNNTAVSRLACLCPF